MNMSNGFREIDIDFKDLHKILKMKGRYSNFYYKNNTRKSENYIPNITNCLILDIDDGVTIKAFKEKFKKYAYCLGTTKSHQKDKKGLVCDRFRVIFPTETAVSLNSEDFSKMMKDLFIDFPECDRACSDTSRFYSGYENAEIYTQWGYLFDWEKYYKRALHREKIELELKKTKANDFKSQEVDIKDIEIALSRISPDLEYLDWVRIGMSLKTELGDGGFYLFDEWSSRGSSYGGEKQTMNHWKSFKRQDVGIGTLFFMSKQ